MTDYRCEDCGQRPCRDCGRHYCCDTCPCGLSHTCACECRSWDHRATYAH